MRYLIPFLMVVVCSHATLAGQGRSLTILGSDAAAASRGLDRAQEASGGNAVVTDVRHLADGRVEVVMELPETAADVAREQMQTEPGVTVEGGAAFQLEQIFSGSGSLHGQPVAGFPFPDFGWTASSFFAPAGAAGVSVGEALQADGWQLHASGTMQFASVAAWTPFLPVDALPSPQPLMGFDMGVTHHFGAMPPSGVQESVYVNVVDPTFKTSALIWVFRKNGETKIWAQNTWVTFPQLVVPNSPTLDIRFRGTRNAVIPNLWDILLEVRDSNGALLLDTELVNQATFETALLQATASVNVGYSVFPVVGGSSAIFDSSLRIEKISVKLSK